MPMPNQPRVVRSVGSDLAELVGRALMLDVLDQMREQPDHWVLVPTLARRTGVDPAQIPAAIAAVVARGWLEADFQPSGKLKRPTQDVRRVRLTAEGRALFGGHARMHVTERPRARQRVVRRALPSRRQR